MFIDEQIHLYSVFKGWAIFYSLFLSDIGKTWY